MNEIVTLDLSKAGTEKAQPGSPISWEERVLDGDKVEVTTLGKNFTIHDTDEARDNLQQVIEMMSWTNEQWIAHHVAVDDATRSERFTIVHKGRIYDPTALWGLDFDTTSVDAHRVGGWNFESDVTKQIVVHDGVYLAPGGSEPLTGDALTAAKAPLVMDQPDSIEVAVRAFVAASEAAGVAPSSRAVREGVPGRGAAVDEARKNLVEWKIIQELPGKNGGKSYALAEDLSDFIN